MYTKFWSENLKGSDHFKELGENYIRTDVSEIRWEGVD
jgi:hypothetical protein